MIRRLLTLLLRGLILSTLAAGCGGPEGSTADGPNSQRVSIVPKNSFGRVVPDAEIFVDEIFEGRGPQTLTLDMAKPHTVRGGDVRLYDKTPPVTTIDGLSGNQVKLIYEGLNLAEECLIPVYRDENGNEQLVAVDGIRIGDVVVKDQQQDGSFCAAVDADSDVRAISLVQGSFYAGEFFVPAEQLEVGKSHVRKMMHIAGSQARPYCALTTPVRGEVFVVDVDGNRRSVGWQPQDGLLCTWVDKETEVAFAFGPVNGDTPFEVEFAELTRLANSSSEHETAVGWYHRGTTDLHCQSVKGPYGPGSASPEFLRIDRIELPRPYDNRVVCGAVIAPRSHSLYCGPALYNDLEVVEAEIPIPANREQAGQLFSHTCEYRQKKQPAGETNPYLNLEVGIFAPFTQPNGQLYPLVAHSAVNGSSHGRGERVFWNGNVPQLEPEGLTFSFEDEGVLLASPPFVMGQPQLLALDPTHGSYNMERNTYVFAVQYGKTAPTMMSCAVTETANVRDRNPMGWFNRAEANFRGDKEACLAMLIAEQISVAFGYYSANYRTPHPFSYPPAHFAGKDGQRVEFLGKYIREDHVGELAIGTAGQRGEVFITDGTGVERSIGVSAWADGRTNVRVNVDVQEETTLRFAPVGGVSVTRVYINDTVITTPNGTYTFRANDPQHPDGPGTIPWQSSVTVVAHYGP